MKKVSIIIPTYNRAYCIMNSINSVLAQTYPHFELLIVDDGSTDDTEALIHAITDERVRYLKMPQNGGASAARNYGMQHATCEYIAFQDSDDFWHPNKLELQVKAMEEHPSVGFSYHKIRYNLDENRCIIMPREEVALEQKSGDIYAELLRDNLVPCPSLMMRKSLMDKVGYFDTEMNALEDYDYALRLGKEAEALFLDEILLEATLSEDGVSSNNNNHVSASCMLVYKYKADLLKHNALDHRLEKILRDAQILGIQNEVVALLEKIMMG